MFETLEQRDVLDASLSWIVTGDSNHDGHFDNADYQAALCHQATAAANRPTADTAYQATTQPLFASAGPVYTDVQQGSIGDCGLVAAFAEIAYRDPSAITGMFADNFDGTYTVRFFDPQDGGKPHYTVVDTYLPTDDAYAGVVTWVGLAEKAYAQINKEGWLDSEQNGVDAYAAIAGTYPFDAVYQTTQQSQVAFNYPTDSGAEATFANALNAGKLITFATNYTTSYMVGNHAYAAIAYDAPTHDVTLYNPWGRLETYTWNQIEADASYFTRTT